jgi:hypothetical protein
MYRYFGQNNSNEILKILEPATNKYKNFSDNVCNMFDES